eukprot:scaffold9629_cov136-Cylindrotheca_fusiformis.AAC.2
MGNLNKPAERSAPKKAYFEFRPSLAKTLHKENALSSITLHQFVQALHSEPVLPRSFIQTARQHPENAFSSITLKVEGTSTSVKD